MILLVYLQFPAPLQRLEFLGDAVLDHIFTDYFYQKYPECTPELLTDLRSASVNNSCYAHAAVKAGLHKHILHSSSALHKRMSDYLDKFKHSFSGPSHGWEAGIGLPKVHLLDWVPSNMANFSCHASINIFMLQQFFSFDNGLGTI
jgi:endoribonuclease Dicer